MADIAALHGALQRIGFSQEAREHITNIQDLTSLDDFKILTDKEVENLCQVIRKPGGTIPNPAVAGQVMPNPGISVSLKATNNLKLMCYWLRHQERTSHVPTSADINVDTIRTLIGYRQWEEEQEEPKKPELTFKDWTRTFETIEDYLRECLGTTKIPLAYIIRENVEVPPSGEDPPDEYATIQDEIIKRAPYALLSICSL